ncbi:hypothetical protein [Methylomarinovum tepidoasis]|uniref:hypothetical protein n=1 Tax=Methylomarinovum tepidoasis TaxID=2840183 RepID=UPI0025741BC5|nr:hypothetical protein [Methylomarinovum sp. IN45]
MKKKPEIKNETSRPEGGLSQCGNIQKARSSVAQSHTCHKGNFNNDLKTADSRKPR